MNFSHHPSFLGLAGSYVLHCYLRKSLINTFPFQCSHSPALCRPSFLNLIIALVLYLGSLTQIFPPLVQCYFQISIHWLKIWPIIFYRINFLSVAFKTLQTLIPCYISGFVSFHFVLLPFRTDPYFHNFMLFLVLLLLLRILCLLAHMIKS